MVKHLLSAVFPVFAIIFVYSLDPFISYSFLVALALAVFLSLFLLSFFDGSFDQKSRKASPILGFSFLFAAALYTGDCLFVVRNFPRYQESVSENPEIILLYLLFGISWTIDFLKEIKK